MFTAKWCMTSGNAAARFVVRVLALASCLAVASATAPLLQLSGVIGGLQAEYFYFSSGLESVAVLDGATADLT
eukprot:3027202-Amphidinium_carterae.1